MVKRKGMRRKGVKRKGMRREGGVRGLGREGRGVMCPPVGREERLIPDIIGHS